MLTHSNMHTTNTSAIDNVFVAANLIAACLVHAVIAALLLVGCLQDCNANRIT